MYIHIRGTRRGGLAAFELCFQRHPLANNYFVPRAHRDGPHGLRCCRSIPGLDSGARIKRRMSPRPPTRRSAPPLRVVGEGAKSSIRWGCKGRDLVVVLITYKCGLQPFQRLERPLPCSAGGDFTLRFRASSKNARAARLAPRRCRELTRPRRQRRHEQRRNRERSGADRAPANPVELLGSLRCRSRKRRYSLSPESSAPFLAAA